MSVPMTTFQIQNQLKKFGVVVGGYKNWTTHNRGDRGNGWRDLRGIMVHHTGSDSKSQNEFLYTGSSALPGPLCQMTIDAAGKLWMIGWGRANHAGGGDPKVLAKVTSEEYTGVLKPTEHEGSAGAVDGNGHFYGIEVQYSGGHGMTQAQYRTLLKVCAAICDFHDWSHRSVIGHGEWSNWKWDPGYASGKMMDMHAVRNDVHTTLNPPPPPPVPAPKPSTPAIYNVKTGDTIVFPGGGKVVVK